MPKKKSKMKTWQILLLAFGGGLVLLVALVIGFAVWLDSNKDELVEEGKTAKLEAQAFASGKTEVECRTETFRRHDECGSGFVCKIMTKIFFEECLHYADVRTTLCDGVPAKDDIVETLKWVVPKCAGSQSMDSSECQQLYGAIQEYCDDIRSGVGTII